VPPVAATRKVTELPEVTDWLAGCEAMARVLGLLTVSRAALDVTLPALLLTVTVKEAPLSLLVTAGVV